MRVVLVSMVVMLAAPRAEACPDTARCVSTEPRVAPEETPRPRVRGSTLQLAIRRFELDTHHRLATSLRTHVAPPPQAIEMPWIWQVLRRSVYARMPRYQRVARRPENRFSFVVSPVVVESPQDTVPGVGLEGGF